MTHGQQQQKMGRFENGTTSARDCLDVDVLLRHINDWTTLRPVQIVFCTVYLCIFLLGMTANFGIIVSIMRKRKYKFVANLLLMNLAAVDMFLCLTALPVGAIRLLIKRWLFGSFLCSFIPLYQGASVIITSFSLSCIAIDRYLNIVKVQLLLLFQCISFMYSCYPAAVLATQ